MNRKLEKTNSLIAKIVDGHNLSAAEAEEVFSNIYLCDSEGFHFATILAAIHTKGETSDELLGLCRTYEKLGSKLRPNIPAEKITDLAGTGGGNLKTFNVSTTASFVVAGADFAVAKEAFYGITSPTGSADVFATFGVDISKLSVKKIEETLEIVGICPRNLSFISPRLKNFRKINVKFFVERKVRIGSPLHLVANVSPLIPMKYRIYGCYSDKYLEILGELFSKLGYKRTLTFHGIDGLPEISNIGKTVVVEQQGKKLKCYTINPKDFGVKKSKAEQIKTGGKERNITDFLRVIYAKEKGAKRDIVLANAAASLYVMDRVKDLAEGVKLAGRIIDEGLAFKKLESLVDFLGDKKLLNQWKKKAF
jgi:anthranilate phosphoribosyltransferase